MKPIKELDFHSKVLNEFYNEYPIQLHVGEFYFEYDDEEEKWRIVVGYLFIKNRYLDTIITEEEEALEDGMVELVDKWQEPFICTVDELIGPCNEDFQSLSEDQEFMNTIRNIYEEYINKMLDKHVEEIKQLYYQIYYLIRCK